MNCQEQDNIIVDKQVPNIDIISPERNTVYKSKDTVFIVADLTDNVALRRASIHIHDLLLLENDTVFRHDYVLEGEHFEIDTFYIVENSNDRNFSIYIDATDNAENFTEKLRNFFLYH